MKTWMPGKTGLTPQGRKALTVRLLPGSNKPKTKEQFRDRLESKLARLITLAQEEEGNVRELLRILPDLEQEAVTQASNGATPSQLAAALMEQDSLALLVDRVNLDEGKVSAEARLEYERQDLRAFLQLLASQVQA